MRIVESPVGPVRVSWYGRDAAVVEDALADYIALILTPADKPGLGWPGTNVQTAHGNFMITIGTLSSRRPYPGNEEQP